MTVGEFVDHIIAQQEYFNYTVIDVDFVTGTPDYVIEDSLDGEVVISSQSAYSFGQSVKCHYRYEMFFRFNNDLNSVQISVESNDTDEFIYLLLMKFHLYKITIKAIIRYWRKVNKDLFTALFSYASFAVLSNYSDVLDSILSADWDSIVEELNCSMIDSTGIGYYDSDSFRFSVYPNESNEPRFAVRLLYDYSDSVTHIYDSGFVESMFDSSWQRLFDTSISRDHSECTMILLRWKEEHSNSRDYECTKLRL